MKFKVLIVDDDYTFAEFAKLLLQSLGHSAVMTLRADKALEAAAREKPDVVLMDYAMDEMTGVDALKILKDDPRTRAIPVIMCSITRGREDMKEAFECGAAGFLPKPLSREMLKTVLEKTLGGRR